jgi:hypothetical protein
MDVNTINMTTPPTPGSVFAVVGTVATGLAVSAAANAETLTAMAAALIAVATLVGGFILNQRARVQDYDRDKARKDHELLLHQKLDEFILEMKIDRLKNASLEDLIEASGEHHLPEIKNTPSSEKHA